MEHLIITGKPDLREICKRLGLRIKEIPLTGAHGALVRSKNSSKGIISVKASLREETQKRFTVAHEIGHFVIPYHKDLSNVCDARTLGRFGKTLPRPELEANEFAAELLLPARLVRMPLRVDTPSLETISSVATEFETSLTSATWRFLDLTDQPCAMIWSHKGGAVWYRTSDALSIELPLQELPASQSIAGRLFAGKQAPSAGPVDPYLWCRPQDAECIHTLIEESLRLPNYDAVLTLLWANKMSRPIECEEEELLPELTPEAFSLDRKRWPR
jgi:Zn-dependent peptidase ImmA (M78 family)